jgi:membrane-bound lytic murein transglycosylase D
MPRHFFVLVVLLCSCAAVSARAAEALPPQPPELQQDVAFWVRVYSEISTNEGFVHDQRNLAVVYEKLSFPPDLAPKERQAQVDRVRLNYQQILTWLASGASPRDAEEQRVRDLWSQQISVERLAQAANDVRFQLGQADRFRAGLQRAGRWEPHIARTLAAQGLPPELAVLPHVESSFDPEAYSKAGAAGLWQFMRSTGRRFMRVDTVVDERMDPFRATEAAAQLLSYNYRVLGSWPLAITAYNHGAEGMRRARDRTGTDDIVRILREYNSPLFGFASRNFYVSFLAALTVERDRERYFPGLKTLDEVRMQEVPLQAAVSIDAIERAVGASRADLRMLNPALRAPVWSGARTVPAGYRLRLPLGAQAWNADTLNARLALAARPEDALATSQPNAVTQVVQAVDETRNEQERRRSAAAPHASEAVTASQARSQGPALLPGAEAALSADAIDYAVAGNSTIRVAAEETLGHYADWLELPTETLRRLNAMTATTPLRLGERIHLDFTRVALDRFETRRREYHQALQAAFFARHRIVGTEVYMTRRGDTLTSLAQRNSAVPIWLLQQYNPDLDLLRLRAGTPIVLPRTEVRPGV